MIRSPLLRGIPPVDCTGCFDIDCRTSDVVDWIHGILVVAGRYVDYDYFCCVSCDGLIGCWDAEPSGTGDGNGCRIRKDANEMVNKIKS